MKKVFTTFLAIMIPVVCIATHQSRKDSRFIVRVGDKMPTFDFVLLNGDTLDTDYFYGQVVVLQFAASWCPFSQHQLMDADKRLWQRYKDRQDFAMLGVCEDKDEEGVREFIRQRTEHGITIPFTVDSAEQIYRKFVTPNGSVTRTILVDKKGVIADMHDIHTRRDARQIRRMVRYLLRLKD